MTKDLYPEYVTESEILPMGTSGNLNNYDNTVLSHKKGDANASPFLMESVTTIPKGSSDVVKFHIAKCHTSLSR
jgi:hypothetical protein